jgi:potassium-transporting ATPase KdpC subunit
MKGLGLMVARALVVTLALLVVCGVAYPAVLFVVARVAFPAQSHGSFVRDGQGRVVGSALIAQAFSRPEYFHGRPSAVGYDAANSGASNLGPSNPARAHPDSLPVDLVTASGSGLDPDISPEGAAVQVARVAQARGLAAPVVAALVRSHTIGRTLGVLGEPRVNVLLVNLALDSAWGRR